MPNDPQIDEKRFFSVLITHLCDEIISCLGTYQSMKGEERRRIDQTIGYGSPMRCIDVWKHFASSQLIELVQRVEAMTGVPYVNWFDDLPPVLKELYERDMSYAKIDRESDKLR